MNEKRQGCALRKRSGKRSVKKPMTIDELIEQLRAMSKESPLRGETVVAVCDPGVPYRQVERARLDTDGDGGVALLFADTSEMAL